MNITNQKLCIYSGIAFMALFAIGWVLIGGLLPPIPPSAGAEAVAAFYQTDTWKIKLGLILAALSVAFYFPWVTALSIQLKRIEGDSPHMAWVQLISGCVGAVIIYLALFFWMVATFRPDRDPNITYIVNDLGWLIFTSTVAPFLIQFIALGLGILADKRSAPPLPHWLGFYSLVSASLFLPAAFIFFFKSGPFAWDGLICFWLPLVDFFIWMIVMTIYMLKATIKEQ